MLEFAQVTATVERGTLARSLLTQDDIVQQQREIDEDGHEALVYLVIVQVVNEIQRKFDRLSQIRRTDRRLVRRRLSCGAAKTLSEQTLELGVPDVD